MHKRVHEIRTTMSTMWPALNPVTRNIPATQLRSYAACKPRSGNHGPEALAGDTVSLDMLEPSDQLGAVGSGIEAT